MEWGLEHELKYHSLLFLHEGLFFLVHLTIASSLFGKFIRWILIFSPIISHAIILYEMEWLAWKGREIIASVHSLSGRAMIPPVYLSAGAVIRRFGFQPLQGSDPEAVRHIGGRDPSGTVPGRPAG